MVWFSIPFEYWTAQPFEYQTNGRHLVFLFAGMYVGIFLQYLVLSCSQSLIESGFYRIFVRFERRIWSIQMVGLVHRT